MLYSSQWFAGAADRINTAALAASFGNDGSVWISAMNRSGSSNAPNTGASIPWRNVLMGRDEDRAFFCKLNAANSLLDHFLWQISHL